MAARLASMGLGQYQSVTSFRRWNGLTAFAESELQKPLRWKKPRSIFVSSMGDLFHDSVSFEWIDAVMQTVIECRQHTFIMLTKRPDRMREYMTKFPWGVMPDNLVMGVSVENQQTADERIPPLLQIRNIRRFISIEPMTGPITLSDECLAWNQPAGGCRPGVILGGESGPKARPLHPAWVRTIRDQCAASGGVPFFFKQWGEWLPCFGSTASTAVHEFLDGERVHRVGKKIAGNVLDGKTHSALSW
jgi:protein gp37